MSIPAESGDLDAPDALPADITEPPAPIDLFEDVASFLRQHLVCSQHQIDVLTLWSVHTWCFRSFATTAYLDIRSPEPQSGKSLCLRLLELLAPDGSLFASGASPATLIKRLLDDRYIEEISKEGFVPCLPSHAIFLDDCQHTFGPSERQPLLALLNCGADLLCSYASGQSNYYVYGPKAFAGNHPLPPSLVARCIPIVLHRKRPSDPVTRFNPLAVVDAPDQLAGWIGDWAEDNAHALSQVSQETPPDLPLNLTPREQACAEPLIHIADTVGGSWPQRARAALAAVFNAAQSSISVELLGDIRAVFRAHSDPEFLASRDLLTALTTLEHRPWGAWPPNSGRRLGTLLRPFGITAFNKHAGPETTFRAYNFKDFADTWERYLPDRTVRCTTKDDPESLSTTAFA
jgi:hypothetical protein